MNPHGRSLGRAEQRDVGGPNLGGAYDRATSEAYQLSDWTIAKRGIIMPSFTAGIGDLSGRSVVDLACGSGASTRVLVDQLGASRAVGVDLSSAQVELAKDVERRRVAHQSKERSSYHEIAYVVGDAKSWRPDQSPYETVVVEEHFGIEKAFIPKIAEFDVVTGEFLLNYARNAVEARQMFETAFTLLRPYGTFVVLIPNPRVLAFDDPKYQLTIRMLEEKESPEFGDLREVTYLGDDESVISQFTHPWLPLTEYVNAAEAEGFVVDGIDPARPSQGAIDRFGYSFFDRYIQTPMHLVLRFVKNSEGSKEIHETIPGTMPPFAYNPWSAS